MLALEKHCEEATENEDIIRLCAAQQTEGCRSRWGGVLSLSRAGNCNSLLFICDDLVRELGGIWDALHLRTSGSCCGNRP